MRFDKVSCFIYISFDVVVSLFLFEGVRGRDVHNSFGEGILLLNKVRGQDLGGGLYSRLDFNSLSNWLDDSIGNISWISDNSLGNYFWGKGYSVDNHSRLGVNSLGLG